jgi:hypothetical protein
VNSESQAPEVKLTALRMDTITDLGAMAAIVALCFGGYIDGDWAFGAILSIAGLMKLDAVRKRGGAVVFILGVGSSAAASVAKAWPS